jgi:hypothetical protein
MSNILEVDENLQSLQSEKDRHILSHYSQSFENSDNKENQPNNKLNRSFQVENSNYDDYSDKKSILNLNKSFSGNSKRMAHSDAPIPFSVKSQTN